MYIKSIEIANFRGIEHSKFEFENGFNLIIGDNGMGKTSILEAVCVALGGFVLGIPNVNTRHFYHDDIRCTNIEIGDGSVSTKYFTPVNVTCDACVDNEPFHWIREKTVESKNGKTKTIPHKIDKKAFSLFNDSNCILPLISYQSASRTWSQLRDKSVNVFDKKYDRSVGYTDCLLAESSMKFVNSWCNHMEYIEYKKKKPISEYESAKNAVAIFLNKLLDINNGHVFFDSVSEEMMFSYDKETTPIRLLSAGYKTLVAMVLEISCRMSMLNPQLTLLASEETSGIVLIDEIDLHLHPNWQWKIIEAFKRTFPKIQFIATTHSPIIIASSKDVHLISLKDSNPNPYILEISSDYLQSAKGWQVNDVLSSLMNSSNRDPETMSKLAHLEILSKKRISNEASPVEIEEYNHLVSELRLTLPEDDIGVDLAGLWSIEDLLKD